MHCGTSSDNSTVHFSVKRKTIDSRSPPGRMIDARFHRQHSDKKGTKFTILLPRQQNHRFCRKHHAFFHLCSILCAAFSIAEQFPVSFREFLQSFFFPWIVEDADCAAIRVFQFVTCDLVLTEKLSFYSPARTFRMPEIFGAEREDHGNSPPALPALRRVSSQFC